MAKEIKKEKKEHSTLTEYEVYEENDQLYIKLVYILEDGHKIEKLTIPKVELPIVTNLRPRLETHDFSKEWLLSDPSFYLTCTMYADYVGTPMPVNRGNIIDFRHEIRDVFYTEETIEEKATEMTLEEIEKKLGYKVVIKKEAAK